MEQVNLIIDTYQRIILESESKLAKVKQHIYRIGTLRLILFAAGIAGIIYFWDEGRLVIGGIAAITFIPFILLVKLHNRLFHQKNYLEKKIEINRQELQALTYDTSAFDNGEEFINPSHLYTYDLDVFGEHSLFQYINRTATQPGKKKTGRMDEYAPEEQSGDRETTGSSTGTGSGVRNAPAFPCTRIAA